MSAAGIISRSCSLPVLAFMFLTLPPIGFVQSGHAGQEAARPATALALEAWQGESGPTLDELKLHALEIGDLLDRASARVDRLAGEASNHPQTSALLGAVRQELNLSRQWNRHLTSILLEVAEARRALGVRERRAAAEIVELTSIAEEARLELIALWKSLRPGMSVPFDEHDQQLKVMPEASSPMAPAVKEEAVGDSARSRTDPDDLIDDARRVLDEMDAMQETAADDIEAVRAKIMDALHTLAPHRTNPAESGAFDKDAVNDHGLSSKEITAWAASIASKLHHEGYESEDQAEHRDSSLHVSVPGVEDMIIESEILSTTPIRIAPHDRASAITTVTAGSVVLVTGKVVDQGWYRVELDGGLIGYVSGDLVRHRSVPSKTEQSVTSS